MLCGAPWPVHGQSVAARDSAAAVPLAVPFLAQTPLLCGGAAVAMVERWFGRRGVYAEDFAGLVRAERGGIVTTELVSAIRTRGWEVWPVTAAAQIPDVLRNGIPVIALLRVASDRYHYVVVTAWAGGRVTYHDPAGMPSTVTTEARFLERWDGADRWAITMLANTTTLRPVPAAVAPDSLPCRPFLDQAVDATLADRFADAGRFFDAATSACPSEPLILRERAGLRFREGNHGEAARIAEQYLRRMPDDTLGWHLLGASRYLTGDIAGALQAANRIGMPRLDLVRVDGSPRFRFQAIGEAVGLAHGALVTWPGLTLARRRVADLPGLSEAAVGYLPLPEGAAEVVVAVRPRPLLEPWPRLVAINAVGALTRREVGITVASPTRIGEVWRARWRWDEARPRAAVGVDLPVRLGTPGVLAIEGTRERFRFALDGPADPAVLTEEVRTASVRFGTWTSAAFRPSIGVTLERWSANARHLVTTFGAELRSHDDRARLQAEASVAAPLGAARAYRTRQISLALTTAPGFDRAAVSARLMYLHTGRDTPLARWPVAGGLAPWAVPLRAHRTGRDTDVPGAQVGRTAIALGLAADHPVLRAGPVHVAAGLFADAVQLRRTLDGRQRRGFLDAGAGLRFSTPAVPRVALRVDYAHSLNGDDTRRVVVSAQRALGGTP